MLKEAAFEFDEPLRVDLDLEVASRGRVFPKPRLCEVKRDAQD